MTVASIQAFKHSKLRRLCGRLMKCESTVEQNYLQPCQQNGKQQKQNLRAHGYLHSCVCVRNRSCRCLSPTLTRLQLAGLHKVGVFLETPQQLAVYLPLAPAEESHPHLTSAPILSTRGSRERGQRSTPTFKVGKHENVLDWKHVEANKGTLTYVLMKMNIKVSRGS